MLIGFVSLVRNLALYVGF